MTIRSPRCLLSTFAPVGSESAVRTTFSIRFCWRPGTACSILMNMRRTHLMRIKAETWRSRCRPLCRYPHETKSPIGWMPFHGKTTSSVATIPGSSLLRRKRDASGTRIIRKTPCMVLRMTTGLNGIPVFQGPVFRERGVDNLSGWRCHPISIRMRLGSSCQGLPERPERFTVCMSREQQPL